MHNNRPHPVLPREDVVGLVPAGKGILNVGGDRVTVRHDNIVGNDSGGIAVIALPFPNPDPRVDPFPDSNRVVGNVALANGRSPDPLRSPFPGADLIYDGSGSCFADNVFATSVPPAL